MVKSFDRGNLSFPISPPDNWFKATLSPPDNWFKSTFFYNPDFVVTYINGYSTILEIKSKHLMQNYLVREKIKAGFELTKYTALGFQVWTNKELFLSSNKTVKKWFLKQTGRMEE